MATTTNNIKTYGSTDTTIYDNTTNLSGYEINGSIKGNIKGVVEISVDGGYENKTTTKDGTDTVNKTGSDEDEGSGSQSGTIKNHTSNTVDTSTWSNETGYGGSEVNEKTQTVAQAISELISEKQSIGETYLTTGSETNSQGLSSTNANKNEFSSQVTYSQVASEEIEVTYTTNTAISGYHRWVMAVTAYVYGVVGYDVANECYFTYTYSVMDDDYHKYQDYSYENSEYSDNLSSVIDFCIPSDITDYVESRVFAPDGMEFDLNGNVTAYNGDDSLVIIPDYVAVELNDGTKAAVKVTGIGADVFRGNENITGVTFSDYITEIPAGAFMGCTNLWDITAAGVTKIGEAAFAGCPHFGNFTLSSDVTELGENVLSAIEIPDRTELKEVELADVQFSTGTAYFEVEAANAGVVESAIKSGAAEITIDLGQMSDSVDNQTLTIPEGTEVFVIRGRGASYNDLTIVSHADVTRLSRMTIHSSGSLPLELYSKEVGLNQITVDASSAALALLADNTEVNLYGPNNLTSSANTLFVKNATLGKLDGNLSTSLNVGGNIVTCGSISDSDGYLKQSNGEVLVVDLDTFNNLLRSYNLIFDANGGVCETESVEVANGVAIGELPVPTREYFTFEGWYTAAEDGDLVTSETAFSSGTDVTIYAHWAPNEYTATWTEEKGATITVERTDSPYAVAELGALESGAVVYYGDVLSVTYAPATGFELGECGETEITVSGDVTEESIFAHANGLAYTVSWNTGTGYKIAVSRTESPNYGAETGALDSGGTVYYGDVLEISYTAAEGYTLVDSGETEITVTGDVGSGRIYASATPNNYTYNVVYRSSNGTNLGSTTVTKAFGTRNTISAPAKSGYTTPASQTVKWDSTTPKTITFTYGIKGVSGSQAMSSGNWNIWSGKYGVTYSASAEYRNRTATSVQIRVKWTNTLTANTYYGFAQYFTAKIGGISAGEKQIASSSTWATMSSSSRSATAYSGWVTVPVSATSRSVSISATYRDLNGVSGSWSKTMTIPTY
ncbi:MAG TPA: InlB B-repeat-containing protein [Candidatus Onthomonas avicola]|nr:InlB B-repeat-containing protein [Candidatus Onthomonas avicola]